MHRLLTRVTVGTCPRCLGREVAEQIAREEARHPLETMLWGTMTLQPPTEFGVADGRLFMIGVYDRLEEITMIRVTCN